MAKVPLDDIKMKQAKREIIFISSTIDFCINKINQGILIETLEVIEHLINYIKFTKNGFLISPKLRKEYRNFIFLIINIYPEIKQKAMESVFRILGFKNDYYYIK